MKRLALLLPVLFALCSCSSSNNDVAGGPGSETTNGIVALVDGSPASFAGVAMRKADFIVNEYAPENAMIQADAYADENGTFSLDVKDDETFRLTIVHNGAAFSQVFTGEELDDIDTLKLAPTATVSGTVSVPEGSDFVWVGVHGMDVMVKSDARGNFAMPQLPSNDSLELYFVRDGERSEFATVPVKLTAFENETIDVLKKDSSEKKSNVASFVAETDGAPAAYAMLALRPVNAQVEKPEVQNAAILADAYSDAAGRFSFTLPDSGKFRFTVVQAGYAYSKVMSVKEIAALDTISLKGSATMPGKVTLKSSMKFAWVGVKGLDVLVKTDFLGQYTLPSLPAGDTLELYFLDDQFDTLSVTQKVILKELSSDPVPPYTLLQDFEGDLGEWYISKDTVGSKLVESDIAKTIEYDKTRKSKVFHGGYTINAENNYSWVLVGTTLQSEAWNFMSLDSIEFYAKGDGQIRVAVENWNKAAEEAGFALKASSSWMDMNGDKWQRYVARPADLCFSSQEIPSCAISWDSVKGYVRQLHFFTRGGSEFYIDDVTLYGVLF